MKKISSSLQNLILVLVGCALITGVLLAWVNHITEGPIAEKAEKTLADGIQEVMGTTGLSMDGKEATFVVHQTADRNGRPLGAAVESTTLGFGGDLRVLVGFNPQGAIQGYTILQTSETPGLGAKAQTWFQKGGKGDIIGMRPNEALLSVSKDGGQVDAITASTITSRAFLKAVNQAYAAYSQSVKHEHRTVNANK